MKTLFFFSITIFSQLAYGKEATLVLPPPITSIESINQEVCDFAEDEPEFPEGSTKCRDYLDNNINSQQKQYP